MQHGGNIDGMRALVGLMPEEKFGLVILTNMDGNLFRRAHVPGVRRLPEDPPKDWSAQLHKGSRSCGAGKAEEKKREAARVEGTSPRCRWSNTPAPTPTACTARCR